MELPVLAKDEVLERVDGDIEFLTELTNDFLATVPTQLADLNSFIDQNDFEKTESKAHSMKGALRNLGALKSGDSAGRLELLARQGHAAQARVVIAELAERLSEYEREFKEFIATM